VRDHRARDGDPGIDVDIGDGTIQALVRGLQERGMCHALSIAPLSPAAARRKFTECREGISYIDGPG